jgi:hypothetical protein
MIQRKIRTMKKTMTTKRRRRRRKKMKRMNHSRSMMECPLCVSHYPLARMP